LYEMVSFVLDHLSAHTSRAPTGWISVKCDIWDFYESLWRKPDVVKI